MKLTDIISLTKAGYKKSDIEAIIKAEESNEVSKDSTAENLPPEGQTEITIEKADSKADSENVEEHTEAKDVVDYKKLYEDKCAELKLAQENNIRQNVKSEEKEPSVNDILDLLY